MLDTPQLFAMAGGVAGRPLPAHSPVPAAPLWHVPVALGFWVVSVFLLLQGAAFLKWTTQNDDGAPDPRAGIMLAWCLTAAMMLFFFVNSSDRSYQEAFSQALLFSSLPIGILAAFKFLMAASLVRSEQVASSALTRSPLTLLAAGLFTLLQLAGSIASLLALFR